MLLSVYQFMAECSGLAGSIVFAKANTLEIYEKYIWNACVMPSMKVTLPMAIGISELFGDVYLFQSVK